MNVLIVKPLVDRLYDPNDVSISMYDLSFQDHFICSNTPATEGFNDSIAFDEGLLYGTVSVIQ